MIENYTKHVAGEIKEKLLSEGHENIDFRFASDITNDKLVSFTRLIECLPHGSATHSFFLPEVHLLFHAVHGNWLAWRFIMVFEQISWDDDEQIAAR